MRVALGIVLAALLTGACGGAEHELVGVRRDPAPRVDAVALPDVSRDGDPFTLRAPADGTLLVYFGYTNCPDVCPTTLANVRAALGELGDDADRVDVAMVTVDPGRDTDVLASYVQAFVPDAHALATDDGTALRTVADSFGVFYDVATSDDGEVAVAHTSALFAVDDTGTLALTWLFAHDAVTSANDLAADIGQLLEEAA